MHWPDFHAITHAIRAEQAQFGPDDEWEIRLHEWPDGRRRIHLGDKGSNLDEGFVGIGTRTSSTDPTALAWTLFGEAQALAARQHAKGD
jgi:hypothetical protein